MTDIDTATRIAVESVRAVTDTLNPLLAEKDALIASQAARIRELEEAAEQARLFIASEYKDPAMEERGEWLPPDARKVHNALAGLLSRKGGE